MPALIDNEYLVRASSVKAGDVSSLDADALDHILVNAWPLSKLPKEGINYGKPTIISIRVDRKIKTDQTEIHLVIDEVQTTFTWERPKSVLPDPNMRKAVNLNKPRGSYMMLRVNPKISGNVKVVVDSDSDLFLDAFKVNAELSRRKYRRVPVRHTDYYGRNVAAYAANMPAKSYMYAVPDEWHKIFSVVNDFKDQYVDMYRYGVTTNTDKLYSENFALLAPLKIGETLPDFFIVMKVPGTVDLTSAMSDTAVFKKMMADGKIIKSYDMRQGSRLGRYVRTIQDRAKSTHAPLYVAYNPTQFNTYTGISLDKGTASTIYESPYALKYRNQVQADNFYTLGFERNGMLSDSVVNFEFMFDDPDSDTFSIDTYFGLYIKMNGYGPLYNVGGQFIDADGNAVSYDWDASGSDILYCCADSDRCRRISGTMMGSGYADIYKDKPGHNVFVGMARKIESRRFVTMRLNDALQAGEHFRIIDETNESDTRIYELIFSDSPLYKKKGVSYVTVNAGTDDTDGRKYTITRVSMYAERESVTDQCAAIAAALNILDGPYEAKATYHNLSVTSDKKLTFQRVSRYTAASADMMETYKKESAAVSFFSNGEQPEIALTSDYDDPALTPINFEVLGPRPAWTVEFMDASGLNTYEVQYIDNYKKAVAGRPVMTMDASGKYVYLSKIGGGYMYSYNNPERAVIFTESPLDTSRSVYLYIPMEFDYGVCGIFPVRDYNFDVMDNVSNIAMAGESEKVISDRGATEGEEIYEDDTDKTLTDRPSEVFSSYIGKDDSVPLYAQNPITDYNTTPYTYKYPAELSMNKYLRHKYERNITRSQVSLVSPYNCKWRAVGTDTRGVNIKLTYNNSMLRYNPDSSADTVTSFFIPADYDGNAANSKFASQIGYMSCPEISGGTYRKYFEGTFLSTDENLAGNLTISDMLMTESNHLPKFSTLYSRGMNTVEMVSGGVKINISSQRKNVINTDKWDNFAGIIAVVKDGSVHDMEIVVDETAREIAIIWHKNMSTLVYADRNRSIDFGGLTAMKMPSAVKSERVYSEHVAGKGWRTTIPSKMKIRFMAGDEFFIESSAPGFTTHSKAKEVKPAGTDKNVNRLYSDGNDDIRTAAGSYVTDNQMFNLMSVRTGTDGPAVIWKIGANDGGSDHAGTTYDDFKSAVKDAVMWVKTADGVKYYDNVTADLFGVTVVDPIDQTFIKTNRSAERFWVHPTYFEPETVSGIDWKFNNKELSETMGVDFRSANVSAENVAADGQMWFNKYSEDTKYCVNTNATAFGLGIDFERDWSVVRSAWSDNFFNKYARDPDQDRYDRINLDSSRNFIISDRGATTDSCVYDYLPKTPEYLLSTTNIEISDVKSGVEVSQEIFNASSYNDDVNNVWNADKKSVSYNVESPNFNR